MKNGITLTNLQNKTLDKMAASVNLPTAKDLGVTMRTMKALKQKGLIRNIESFDDKSVIGKESETIRWIFAKA